MDYKEALYLERQSKVIFESNDAEKPALFYMNSTPAHTAFPNKKVGHDQTEVIELVPETANARTLRKLIVNSIGYLSSTNGYDNYNRCFGIQCQLTYTIEEWKFILFEVPQGQAVCHFMGQPQETDTCGWAIWRL